MLTVCIQQSTKQCPCPFQTSLLTQTEFSTHILETSTVICQTLSHSPRVLPWQAHVKLSGVTKWDGLGGEGLRKRHRQIGPVCNMFGSDVVKTTIKLTRFNNLTCDDKWATYISGQSEAKHDGQWRPGIHQFHSPYICLHTLYCITWL